MNRHGEMAIEIRRAQWAEITTSSDLYWDFNIVDAEPGLYVTPEGILLGRHHNGKRCYGRGGQCTVNVLSVYELIQPDVPASQQAEQHLRQLAMPLLAILKI